ncbi:MAG: hypothetical protein PUE91_08560 [Clostridiales bacterium]|nr:hypothetical protein [Clostridiales bacterium]
MPKLKREPVKYENLLKLIFGYMKVQDLTIKDISDEVRQGCTYNTLCNRLLRSPEKLTLQNISWVARKTGIPIDELRAAITLQ